MKIICHAPSGKLMDQQPVDFEKFLEDHELEIHATLRENPVSPDVAWYADLGNFVDIKDGIMAAGFHTDGETPEDAARKLKDRLSGRTLIIQPPGTAKRYLECPIFK